MFIPHFLQQLHIHFLLYFAVMKVVVAQTFLTNPAMQSLVSLFVVWGVVASVPERQLTHCLGNTMNDK